MFHTLGRCQTILRGRSTLIIKQAMQVSYKPLLSLSIACGGEWLLSLLEPASHLEAQGFRALPSVLFTQARLDENMPLLALHGLGVTNSRRNHEAG
jgi:hypothetical protein